MLLCFQLRPLVISAFILPSLAHAASLESRAPPLTVPHNDLTFDTPFPSNLSALAALSNVTLLQPATGSHLLNASMPIPYSRLTVITNVAAMSLYPEDSYALLSWLQYKAIRLILLGGDAPAPIHFTEAPVPGSGRTFSYAINEEAVGAEKLRTSDVATVCAGLVILLRQLKVGVLDFDVSRDTLLPPVMSGTLVSAYGGSGDEVAVD